MYEENCKDRASTLNRDKENPGEEFQCICVSLCHPRLGSQGAGLPAGGDFSQQLQHFLTSFVWMLKSRQPRQTDVEKHR